jgi:Zn-dependent protease with chaperone function
MTTGSPGPALAGDAVGPPARDGSAGARVSVFALPAKTSFRFALLIVAVLTSSGMVYEAIYFATPRGAALAALVRVCQARALATHPQGYSAYAAALARARACRAGGERVEGLWALLGIGVLAVLAGAMYWAQPWWYRRHRRLVPLTSEEAPKVIERLEQLREHAGVGPVTWLQQPLNFAPSAFAFGRVRRRIVAVSGGAVVSQARQPAVFDAIVVHELSHIRNRDIDQTYLAVAVWWAFVVAALLPMAGLLISGKLSPPAPLIWRAVVLALLVYLLRNSILRSREFGADARVAELDPDTSLGQVLAGQPPRRGRRIWHMGWLHPSGRDRAAALLDPAPVYRCGFWDGLAIGLVAAMGAEAGRDLAERFLTPSPGTDLIPAFIFALFSGAALTVAMWRMRLLPGGTATAGDWAVGLGLGIGVAIGPVIALDTALDKGVAPDSLHTGSFIVVAIWVLLITFLFVSFPAWIGRWADAWQQRERRVPARGGMMVAAVGTWVVLAISIGFVLTNFTSVEEFDASTKTVLEQTWTFTGYDSARTTSAWVVVLVFIAVPLSGFLAGLRQRSLGDGHRTAPATRRWLNRARPAALICLAGLVAVIAVTLVTAAVARAHIAPAIRWNGLYFGQFLLFEEQMVILLAVIIALIAAAVLTYELSDMIAIVVAAVVAALGILAVMGSQALGNCVALFNLTYGHQPAGDCPGAGDPRSLVSDIFPAAIEAALISILVIPAAYYAGILIARRAGLGGRPRLATRALGWLAAGAVAAAVIVGISLRVPDASAHGIQPIGSIGQDGWVHGTGYEIRIFPNWYDSPASNRGNILIVYDGRYSGVSAYLTLLTVRVGRDAKITGKGGHAFLLNGAPGLTFMSPDVHGYFIQRWLVIRGSLGYILTFRTMTADRASREPNISSMINTWQWDANSS